MPLVSFREVSIHFGHSQLLDKVDITIEPGERTCLLGRNGAGKTTLLKLLLKQIEPDTGEVIYQSGLKIAALEQEVPTDTSGSVFDVVSEGLGKVGQLLSQYEALTMKPDHDEKSLDKLHHLQNEIDHLNAWTVQQKVASTLSSLSLDSQLQFEDLSGGLKRRVLLAKALVSEPDLLLLDEPTNHLDIASLEFLENFLPTFQGSILFITHDRTFLQKLANRIIELDRGHIYSFSGTYHKYLANQAERLESEEKANALFDKRLAEEEVWVRQGIKARRTRNEGRVRALKKLREEFSDRRGRQGASQLKASQAERSGKMVVEAKDIHMEYSGQTLIDNFSTTIMRGDKIGVLGPNGCGKSTLLNILLGKLEPDAGSVRLGTKLEVAYFDQLRNQLDDNKTVVDNIGDGGEFIEINGNKVHVYSYLSKYLFTPTRVKDKLSKLSGGERNRVLLAKILSKPCNVLVLDEPTNDLDVETLELLEDLLLEYTGTLLLVSHDRSFINNVVTSTIAFEGNGKVSEYVGGYDDWVAQRNRSVASKSSNQEKKAKSKDKRESKNKLSYMQEKRLAAIPAEIETLDAKITELNNMISEPDFYQKEAEVVRAKTEELASLEAQSAALYEEWEWLEALSK